jgi:hypothetical protein
VTLTDLDLNPVVNPMFTHLLARAIAEQRIEAGPKEHAFETPFRHSDAGKCSRYLGLKLAEVPISDDFDLASDWVMGLGTALHEWWQIELRRIYPDAQIEVRVHIAELTSGHIDALITINGKTFSYELKTINGFGFSKAVGVIKSRGGALVPPDGPKVAHIIQACLNAYGCDADYAVVGYLALESISIQVAANLGLGELDRFMAEWIIGRDLYAPIAVRELARLATVKARFDAGRLPAGVAVGDDWSDVELDPNASFRNWRCWYCPYLEKCKTLPAVDIPLAEV